MRIVDLEAKKILSYLYPDQVPILVGGGSRTVSEESITNKGYVCVCDSTIVFAQRNSLKVEDYAVENVYNVNVKNRWFFWYDVEISLKNSYYGSEMLDEIIIKFSCNDKKLAEEIHGIVQDVVAKRKEFLNEKMTQGLVRYGGVKELWGSFSEAKKWFEEHLIERGFKNIDNKWMTERDYNDIIKSRYVFSLMIFHVNIRRLPCLV